ncbi:MAG TPA: class I SAM-dependent rRNA methyltransferase [Polyangiaceae bacterium]|nr:class I SAM-dependent rRNA methyltransferase [Polyangiaceae bacterium]
MPPTLPRVTLKPGHVQPIWTGHPWVYAQAVERVEGGARPGDEVAVTDPRGQFLGRGFYSPSSAIAVRVLTRDPDRPLDGRFFRDKIAEARDHRRALHLPNDETNAYRLVHAEGDGLPGLVVDVFDDACVVQATTLGMRLREALWLEALREVLAPRAIIDRTPPSAGKAEGFRVEQGVLRGDPQISALRFRERGLRFEIPPELGQKTGFYFDQRPLRARVEQLARGRRVLDAYAFVGTFSLAAARGGAADVLAVDESAIALDVAARIAQTNGLDARVRYSRQDASAAFSQAGREGGYDLVICDPPKLVPSRAARDAGLGAYRRLAGLAARATKPGGLLIFCSCSASVGLDDLVRALALGARDVGLDTTVLERHFQGADHPVPAAFPEGLYLKTLLTRVTTPR